MADEYEFGVERELSPAALTPDVRQNQVAKRPGLDLIADNLPGELGRIARAARDAIAVVLDAIQARLDEWAALLHTAIDTAVTALRERLHQLLTALNDALQAIASGIDALLSEGLLAFLRANFPLLASLLDEGLLGPISRAGEALGTWLDGLLRDSGLLEMQEALLAIENSGLCEPMTPEEQEDLCHGFERLLEELLGELDGLLASPVVDGLHDSLEESRNQELDRQVGLIESIYTFAYEVATDVLDWWTQIETAIDALWASFGAYACAIWRHIAAFLELPLDLEPIAALRQKLEELWAEALELVQPIVDLLMDLWRWWNASSFLEPLYQLWDWLGRAWDSIGDLWDWMMAEGEAWLVGLAEAAEVNIIDPLRQMVATLTGLWLSVIDQLAAVAHGLVARLDAFLAALLDIPLLGAVVRVLQALTAPLRTLVMLAFQCFITSLRALAEAMGNLGHYLRVVADIVVGIQIAILGAPLTIITFLVGNVWLRLIPDCFKLAIINFLLDVILRLIAFIPAPADLMLFIVYEAGRQYLQAIRDDQTDRKVRAVDMVARIFAGDLELAAGFAVGLLEALWDSTIGLVIMLLRVLWWLIRLPFQLLGFTGGGDDEAEEEGGEGGAATATADGADAAGAEAEAEARAALAAAEAEDAADGGVEIGPPSTEPESSGDQDADLDAGVTDAPSDTPSGSWDPTRPPEAPPELRQIQTLLQSFVSQRMTRGQLEAALAEFRQNLSESLGDMSAQAADMMLNTLSGDGMAFAVGRAMGYVVGLLVILILLAIFTGPGVAAAAPAELGAAATATTARTGVAGMRAVAQLLPRVRAIMQPMLNGLARFVGPQMRAILARAWPWLDDVARWLRIVLQRGRMLWNRLPPWLRDLMTMWAGWKFRAFRAATRGWAELGLFMSDEVVSEGALRTYLLGLRVQMMRTMPNGLSLRFHAEYDEDQDEWRLRARVRRSMFSSGGTVQSRLVYASWRAGPGWLATDEHDNPWFSTAGDQARRQQRLMEMIDGLLERAAALENPEGASPQSIFANLQDDEQAASRRAETDSDLGLLENVHLAFADTFETGTDERGLPALILHYVISPNTTTGPVVVSTPTASAGTPAPPPETHVRYGGLTSTAEFGTWMHAKPLTREGDEGSEPRIGGTWWDELNLRRSPTEAMGSYYIRGHLLNHNLHGPGNVWRNLSPITRSANSTHEGDVESTLKTGIDTNGTDGAAHIFEYRVDLDYRSGGQNQTLLAAIAADTSVDQDIRDARRRIVIAEQYLPERFLCSAWRLDRAQRRVETLFDEHPITNRPLESSPGDYVVEGAAPRRLTRLNIRRPLPDSLPPADPADPDHRSLALDAYKRLSQVGPTRAEWLYDNRASFRAWTDVHRTGSGLSEEVVSEWRRQTDPVVRLTGDTEWNPAY